MAEAEENVDAAVQLFPLRPNKNMFTFIMDFYFMLPF